MTNPRGASVLVAEDNAVNMEVAKFHLAGLGCAVEGVENGALAVEVLRRRAFDVVLMDCQMPVMDGFEALQHIRAQFASGNKSPALRPPVVIAVTAADDDETRRHCLAAGFDGFLSKPFSKQQLNDAMLSIGNAETSAGASPSALLPAPATAPVIDQAVFSQFVAEFGADVAPTLIGSFMKSLNDALTKLPAAGVARDLPALKGIAHKLAGAAGTIGAAELAQLARRIDASCKRGAAAWGADDTALLAAAAAARTAFAPHALASPPTTKVDPS